MTLDDIKALIEAMASSDLAEMEVGKDGWTLRLVRHREGPELPPVSGPKRAAAARPPVERALQNPLNKPDRSTISAPLAGTIYLSPSPDEPAFVEIGQAIQAGTTVCVIEAMKVFNEVKAERDGTVADVLVAPGDEVDAGQPLIRID